MKFNSLFLVSFRVISSNYFWTYSTKHRNEWFSLFFSKKYGELFFMLLLRPPFLLYKYIDFFKFNPPIVCYCFQFSCRICFCLLKNVVVITSVNSITKTMLLRSIFFYYFWVIIITAMEKFYIKNCLKNNIEHDWVIRFLIALLYF